jgi:hypothetical protein
MYTADTSKTTPANPNEIQKSDEDSRPRVSPRAYLRMRYSALLPKNIKARLSKIRIMSQVSTSVIKLKIQSATTLTAETDATTRTVRRANLAIKIRNGT